MSGVEVVLGLVLGGIPLCISAMEHYADFKKVTGTFIDIRRQHGKDLRRVKLCELQFRLHLKQLLLPLLNDGIVDKPEYAELLLAPGGDGWKEKHVGEALEKRLDEGHQYYVETLKGMVATVAQLCKETYVNDQRFQDQLEHKARGLPANTTQPAQASTVLQLRANDVFHNAMFQGKRIKYAFTGTSRDALFDELEAQISTLRDILSDTDQVSALSQVEAKAPLQKVSKALLQFWSHADVIFKLLRDAWQCNCQSLHCANLWLQHRTSTMVDMQIRLTYCPGSSKISSPPWLYQSIDIRLQDPPLVQVTSLPSTPAAPLSLPPLMQTPSKPAIPTPSADISQPPKKFSRLQLPWRHRAKSPSFSAPGITITPPPAASTSSLPITSGSSTVTTTTPPPERKTVRFRSASASTCQTTASTDSLCAAVAHPQSSNSCILTLVDVDLNRYYAVYPAAEKTPLVAGATSGPDAGTTLADTLKPNFRPRLTRVQRYGIALTLASSHLQLHSTPWLHEQWTAENVHFPLTDDNGALTLHGEPYVLTQFEAANNKPPTGQSDQSFSTLGIVLLELCFGTRFEDHHLWQNPAYAPLRSDPNMRQVIACQWLKDVEGEAGDDYASAVNWTLRQAPLVVQGNKWREEFALNVVQPLQRYYEYLHPAP
ncbi:hypothetical protein LTR29_013440 [Friedmanniomyces endolithicus]|nr:hypothetical protein LTR29_013440 [Friedmanniomyces endolithicus]